MHCKQLLPCLISAAVGGLSAIVLTQSSVLPPTSAQEPRSARVRSIPPVAASLPDSLVHTVARHPGNGPLRLGMPSGVLTVSAEVRKDRDGWYAPMEDASLDIRRWLLPRLGADPAEVSRQALARLPQPPDDQERGDG